MTLAEAIETLSYAEVHACFVECYPEMGVDDVAAHLKVFNELRMLQPVDGETKKIRIEVRPLSRVNQGENSHCLT